MEEVGIYQENCNIPLIVNGIFTESKKGENLKYLCMYVYEYVCIYVYFKLKTIVLIQYNTIIANKFQEIQRKLIHFEQKDNGIDKFLLKRVELF